MQSGNYHYKPVLFRKLYNMYTTCATCHFKTEVLLIINNVQQINRNFFNEQLLQPYLSLLQQEFKVHCITALQALEKDRW